jgi:3-oxoacyl-[acyl-carrier-protein] synthase-1
MVSPSGEGAVRCMRLAMKGMDGSGDVGTIDYLNPHGTGTPIGDVREMEAVRHVFGDKPPLISSTKSLTGHSLGAAGAQEAIYCLLMMGADFAAKSAHIDHLDPAFADLPILMERKDHAGLETVMSNSFGFGGTNGTLVMRRI